MKVLRERVVISTPKEHPWMGEGNLRLEIVDEGGGPFFLLTGEDNRDNPVRVTVEDLETLRETARGMEAEYLKLEEEYDKCKQKN